MKGEKKYAEKKKPNCRWGAELTGKIIIDGEKVTLTAENYIVILLGQKKNVTMEMI